MKKLFSKIWDAVTDVAPYILVFGLPTVGAFLLLWYIIIGM